MIMPVYNIKNNAEYDYLTSVIRDTVRAKLDQKDIFNFINFSEIDESIKNKNLKDNDLIDEKKSTGIALSFGADVIVLTKYIIEGEDILIISQAYDMLTQETSIVSSVSGSTGIEIINKIEKLTNDMADKMAGKFDKIERVVLENLILKKYGKQILKNFQNAQKAEIEKQKKDKNNNYLVFKDKNIQFKKPDGGWYKNNETEAEKFGNFCIFQNLNNKSIIWARAFKLDKKIDFDLEHIKNKTNEWINGMAKKYSYKDLKTLSQGTIKIDGEPSYFQEYTFTRNDIKLIEKIYRVNFNQYNYQFRLSSDQKSFPELKKGFDEWINTIKFIR